MGAVAVRAAAVRKRNDAEQDKGRRSVFSALAIIIKYPVLSDCPQTVFAAASLHSRQPQKKRWRDCIHSYTAHSAT